MGTLVPRFRCTDRAEANLRSVIFLLAGIPAAQLTNPLRSDEVLRMKHLAQLLLAMLAFSLAATATLCRAQPFSVVQRFLERDVQVITVTDTTDAGRKLRAPSPARPAYYEAVILGYSDHGRSTANQNLPDKRDIVRLILKVLADHGYFPATPTHPPEMLLSFSWGTLNQSPAAAMHFMGGDKADVLWELEPLSIHTAARALHRHARSNEATMVVESAYRDLFMISIQAFDEELAKQGRYQSLWHTKISAPSQGLNMASSMKQMIREAGPFLGRETVRPVWTTAPVQEGRVDLGELKTLEAIDLGKLPVTDAEADARAS